MYEYDYDELIDGSSDSIKALLEQRAGDRWRLVSVTSASKQNKNCTYQCVIDRLFWERKKGNSGTDVVVVRCLICDYFYNTVYDGYCYRPLACPKCNNQRQV